VGVQAIPDDDERPAELLVRVMLTITKFPGQGAAAIR